MPLKQLAKQEFVAGATKKAGGTHIKSPRVKVTSLDEITDRIVKMMLYGGQGTGKTYVICGLLELGYKILVLTTDFGGDGLNTVRLEMKRRGKRELLKNTRVVQAEGYGAIRDFIDYPEKYVEGLWEMFVPDVVFWDGFSAFQQVDIAEHVQDAGKGDDSDLKFEMSQWGMVRNATIRTVNDFLGIHHGDINPHKIVTCLEDVKSKEGKMEDSMSPLMQGAGKTLAGAGFDLIWRVVCSMIGTGDNVKAHYKYQTKPDGTKRVGKSRGFEVNHEVPADMYHVWVGLTDELELPRPAGYVPRGEKEKKK